MVCHDDGTDCAGGHWITWDTEEPAVPGDEIMVLLRPAPGALPELPGFPEEDDEREPPRDPATGVNAPRSNALALDSFPNPFNPATTIRFESAMPGNVYLAIYDARGQLVRTLLDESRPAGETEVVWNGTDESGGSVSSGSYYARLQASGRTQVLRLSLIK